MSEALVAVQPQLPASLSSLPIPWRDPHRVPPAELAAYIYTLEQACLDHPASADLRTVLGMAHAVNYDVYKSMDALEEAVSIDPTNFWAQLKYAELHYRLRALIRAEALTVKALDLATNGWQLSIARKQLREIRRLARDSTRNVEWNKPLTVPVLALSAMMLLITVVMLWK